MHTSLVDMPTDLEFIEYVEASYNVNDLARKLGFAHTPGSNSRKKILRRKGVLKAEFKKRHINTINITVNTTFTNVDINRVAHTNFEWQCAQRGLQLFKATLDTNTEYIVSISGKLYKIGIVSTKTNRDGAATFRIIDNSNIDLYYLFDGTTNQGFLLENDGQSSVTIRYNTPKNNQYTNIYFANDYLFEEIIRRL